MLRFCAGWNSWTSEQALQEDLNYIAAAHQGRIEMLQAIFGKPEDEPKKDPANLRRTNRPALPSSSGRPVVMPDADAPPLTPEAFDAMFGDKEPTKQ